MHETDNVVRRLQRLEAARARGRRRTVIGGVVLAVATPWVAHALDAVPYAFVDGDPIVADEINANFDHHTMAITDLEEDVATAAQTAGEIRTLEQGLNTLRQDLMAVQQQIQMLSGLAQDVANVQQDVANVSEVPRDAVVFFNTASCPMGWSEVAATRGRTIVGLTGSGGALAGTVGTALGDLEDRTHTHVVNPASTNTAFDGAHSHQWLRNGNETWSSSGGVEPLGPAPTGNQATFVVALPADSQADFYTSESGAHDHSINIPATTSTTAATSDVIPYVQYLACRKDP
ncbi:MAG: hypothetical protein AAGA48_14225 [Myxococcota bacterium]